MNRRGYRQERVRNSKVPYLLALIIFVLLYIMKNIYEDNKSLYIEKESLNYEIMESDSIKSVLDNKIIKLEKQLDSIKNIKPITKPLYKRRKDPIVTPVTVIADTI
jgi:hypothetical protein